jgi:photosystem II stability/assembly factor-like uncharacterized protein
LSTDGGVNWVGINNNLNDPALLCVAIDPSTPNTIYAGTTNDHVYRSTDGGQFWQRRNSGLFADTIVRIAAVAGSNRVYAVSPGDADDGRNPGVYVSDNRGDTWTLLVDGLSPQAVTALAIDPSNGQAFVGTAGGGVFRR